MNNGGASSSSANASRMSRAARMSRAFAWRTSCSDGPNIGVPRPSCTLFRGARPNFARRNEKPPARKGSLVDWASHTTKAQRMIQQVVVDAFQGKYMRARAIRRNAKQKARIAGALGALASVG